MIGVVDYGAGNLRNVLAALLRLGARARLVARPEDLGEELSAVILPGVGQFGAAARRLRQTGLLSPLRGLIRAGRPLLGICLGMQLLYEGSDEDPRAEGLGILPGVARRLEAARLPHIGWALVEPREALDASIFTGLPSGGFFAYFAHSYAVPPSDRAMAALTTCPPSFASAVRRGAAWGVQFHPEKSGAEGHRVLANFIACAGAGEGA